MAWLKAMPLHISVPEVRVRAGMGMTGKSVHRISHPVASGGLIGRVPHICPVLADVGIHEAVPAVLSWPDFTNFQPLTARAPKCGKLVKRRAPNPK